PSNVASSRRALLGRSLDRQRTLLIRLKAVSIHANRLLPARRLPHFSRPNFFQNSAPSQKISRPLFRPNCNQQEREANAGSRGKGVRGQGSEVRGQRSDVASRPSGMASTRSGYQHDNLGRITQIHDPKGTTKKMTPRKIRKLTGQLRL